MMSGAQLYDTIGAAYTVTRRTEPRIAEQLWAALGDARTVLNVGAGTGSYEPPGRDVTAVEPSAVMRAQRPAGAAPCVAATAERLPFEDQSFDAAMAFATIHHWQDPIAGLREMRRVARRVVVFTIDFSDPDVFWLNRDYLPEFAGLLAGRPPLTELVRAIGARLEPVLIPWDCEDGFHEAYADAPATLSVAGASRVPGLLPHDFTKYQFSGLIVRVGFCGRTPRRLFDTSVIWYGPFGCHCTGSCFDR